MLCAWQISTGKGKPLLIVFCIIMTTLKPNIIYLPIALCLLELFFHRNWKTVIYLLLGLLLVMLFAFITDQFGKDLLLAWRSGDYSGGKQGLVASGYTGLKSFGIPLWIFLPFVGYLIYHWRKYGFTGNTVSFAILIGFLLFPYSRSYDYVLFILPGCVIIKDIAWRNWLPVSLAIISLIIIPYSIFSLLTPVLLTIGLLLLHPA